MSDLSEKTLKQINEDRIKPRSRWLFVAQGGVIWFLFAVSIIAGSLASATIIFLLSDYDWDIYQNLHRSFLTHFFYAVPYFWLAVLGIFAFIAYADFKRTKKGYYYDMALVMGGSVVLSILLGSLLFYEGLDSQIDDILDKKLPFYEKMIYDKQDVWDNAEDGLLGGTITAVLDESNFTVQDRDGATWLVSGADLSWQDSTLPRPGTQIRLIGEWKEDHFFSARAARSWSGQ
jgi:hypothetical protein